MVVAGSKGSKINISQVGSLDEPVQKDLSWYLFIHYYAKFKTIVIILLACF
jgi:hypothetical protein